MSLEMTHEDVQAALAAEALGALEPEEAERVSLHLATCDECRGELAVLRDAAASLAYTVPAAPMDAARSTRLRARLVARARAGREGADASTPARPAVGVAAPRSPASADDDPRVVPIGRARGGGWGGWLAAAAAVVLLLGVGAYAARMKGRYDVLADRYAALGDDRERLVRILARSDSTVAALSGPGVKVIDLASTHRAAPSGRMFWDPATGRWTFFAHDLPALRPQRDYELWLITPDGPRAAGTFRPEPDGRAVVRMTYDLPRGSLKAVAVTEEPAGGLPKPSGTPIILGTSSE